MQIYDHQKKIVNDNPLWSGIFQGTGSGKTVTSLMLAEGFTLVIVEKQLREERKFQKELEKLGKKLPLLTVLSKEDFRREHKKLEVHYDTLIVDEAHNFFGVLPDTKTLRGEESPRTSQLFDALKWYIEEHKPKRFYMLTATPASKPMHVWAIATLLNKKWNFFQFRDTFYVKIKKGYRQFYIPKTTREAKQRLADNVKRFGYRGSLEDFFDVPEQTYKTIHVELTKEQKDRIKEVTATVSDPMALRTMMRSIENGVLYGKEIVAVSDNKDKMIKVTEHVPEAKMEHILKLAEEFPKMLVFADYIGQVTEIVSSLHKLGYNVHPLTGETKNRSSLLEKAEHDEKAIIVCSAKISAGWEWKSCPVVVFASKSNRYLNYEQGLGRVQRADAIKKNLYVHLVLKGGMDEACHESIMAGQDFQELIMEK